MFVASATAAIADATAAGRARLEGIVPALESSHALAWLMEDAEPEQGGLMRKNGEAVTPFSFVQLSDSHVGFNGPPNPLGTQAFYPLRDGDWLVGWGCAASAYPTQMAAAFVAMNDTYGPLFAVSRAEAATPEMAVEAHKIIRELQEKEHNIKNAEDLVKMALKRMAAGR